MHGLLIIAAAAVSILTAPESHLAQVLRDGEASLEAGPYSVMDKKGIAPSGDKHDFLTLSPYYWPNARKKDGLPYVMRDGQLNPEASSDQYDRLAYTEMGKHVRRLGLAYRAKADMRYAEHAAFLIRTWFFEPATRMNPNFQYAQWRPGRDSGSQYGIIRGITLLELHDVTRWIADSEAWTDADEAAWQSWLSAYVDWLLDSDLGQREARARNNHGTWYDLQVARFATYLGQEDRVRKILEEAVEKRIFAQIREDGIQGKEIVRSKSWDYSLMNLSAFMQLARLAMEIDLELFSRSSQESSGIKGALEYMIPFALGEADWPHKQIRSFNAASLVPLLLLAYEVSGNARYNEVAARIDSEGMYRYRYELEHGVVKHGE